jgi:hypothetical protein
MPDNQYKEGVIQDITITSKGLGLKIGGSDFLIPRSKMDPDAIVGALFGSDDVLYSADEKGNLTELYKRVYLAN